MWRILVVEDDPDAQRLVGRALGELGSLGFAGSLAAASAELERSRFDLVLLDVGLPDGDGYRLCSTLQEDPRHADVPVFFLTGRAQTDDKVTAFRLGADDYIEKPFDLRELRARVQARLEKAERRRRSEQVLRRGPLKIDISLYRVVWREDGGERDLGLTPHEVRLLYTLADREARIVSRQQLLEAVWGDTVVLERTVDSHICNLRRKLGAAAKWIRSVRGVGYRFVSPAPAS